MDFISNRSVESHEQQLFRGLYSLEYVLRRLFLLLVANCTPALVSLTRAGGNVGTIDCPHVLIILTRADRRVGAVTDEVPNLTAPVACGGTSTSTSDAAGILGVLVAVPRIVARPAAGVTFLVVGMLTTALAAAAARMKTTIRTTQTLSLLLRPSLISHISNWK